MLMYFGDKDAPLDFRNGGWGFAMHASTWRVHEAVEGNPGRKKGLFRAAIEPVEAIPPLASVMVHCNRTPRAGLRVIYNSTGGPKLAEIYKYEPCYDPRDMFTIFLKMPAEPYGHAKETS